MDIPLQVTFPERDTVVSFDEHADVQIALREGFAAAHRQLMGDR
jgi:hypothetical protein